MLAHFDKPVGTEITELDSKLTSITALTCSVKTGFKLASWGSVTAYKLGKIVIVTASGIQAENAVVSETAAIEISGITFAYTIRNTGYKDMIACAKQNTNIVYLDSIATANDSRWFEIVAFVTD